MPQTPWRWRSGMCAVSHNQRVTQMGETSWVTNVALAHCFVSSSHCLRYHRPHSFLPHFTLEWSLSSPFAGCTHKCTMCFLTIGLNKIKISHSLHCTQAFLADSNSRKPLTENALVAWGATRTLSSTFNPVMPKDLKMSDDSYKIPRLHHYGPITVRMRKTWRLIGKMVTA